MNLKEQEKATKQINNYAIKFYNNKNVFSRGNHYHICFFQMLNNNETRQADECRRWRSRRPIKTPYKPSCIEDLCDYCPMLCYIAVDDEGKPMFLSRNEVK